MTGEVVLKLFVSSPGDVQRERERVDYVVTRLNAEYSGRVRIQTIRWETSYYSSHDTFQAQIPEAADCDLVVAIFGARLGSMLPESFPPMPTGDRYPSGTAYEVLTAIDARRQGKGVPDVYVFRRPSAPLVALDAANRDEIETQWRRLTGFFETWFRNRGGEFLAAFQEFSDTDAFAAKIEDCLRQWLVRRGFAPKVASWDRRRLGSPYPGLAAFDESRQSVFFGRSLLIDQALRRLRDVEAAPEEGERLPFLLLIGASGSGKSSLLRAGLMPKVALPGVLPEIDLWRRAVMIPGLDPFASLAEALLAADALGPELSAGPLRAAPLLAKQLASDPDVATAPLRAALDAAAERRRAEEAFTAPRPARLFLAIDQAERLFFETPPEVAARFAALIAALCRYRIATVAVVLRSDAYPSFQSIDDLVQLRARGATLDVVPATTSELEEMAMQPAALCDPPLTFERRAGVSLASTLVADAEGGDALPLLQMTLARLAAAEAGRGDGVLRYADYAGLADAVSRTANEALAELDASARGQLPNLIAGLVRDFAADPATGKPVPVLGALDRVRFETGRPERKALVEAFVKHRLLTSEGDASMPRARPTHESLLRIWPEAVAILGETEQLIRARAAIEPIARDWAAAPDADKSRHLEVSPALLEGAVAYVERFGDAAPPESREFIAAASAMAEQRRRRELEEQERRIADAEAIARANKRIARTTGVGLAAALALAALAGWQWRESAVAQHEAQTQRDRAERALSAATATADGLVFDLAQKFRDVTGVPKPLVKQILDQARKLQEQLLASGETSAKLTSNHAAALGETAITELALGDTAEALALAQQSREVFAKLVATSPDDVKYVYDLAHTEDLMAGIYRDQAKFEEAAAAYERARSALDAALGRGLSDRRLRQLRATVAEDLGALARARKDLPLALAKFRDGLALAKELVASDPQDEIAEHDLAIAFRSLGDVELETGAADAADADFDAASRVALKLAQDHPQDALLQRDYTLSEERLGEALTKKGNLTAALKAFEDGEATAIEMAKPDPANLDWQFDISIGHLEVGDTQLALGDVKSATASFAEAVAIDRGLVVKDPDNVLWRRHFDDSLHRYGSALEKSGDSAGAIAAFREGRAFDEKYAAGDVDFLRRGVEQTSRVAQLLLAAGKVDEAIDLFRAALADSRRLGSDRASREILVGSVIHLSGALSFKSDVGSALELSNEGASLARALITEDPSNKATRGELALLLVSAARLRSLAGQSQAAVDGLREAIALCAALDAEDPSQPLWRQELATAYDRLGGLLQQGGDAEGAIEAYRKSLATFDTMAPSARGGNGSTFAIAATQEALSRLLEARKQTAEAGEALAAAMSGRRALRVATPSDDFNARLLMVDCNAAGNVFNALQKPADALAAFREGLVIARELAAKPAPAATARHDLALSLFLVGTQLLQTSDAAGAAEQLTEALARANELAIANPANMVYRHLNATVARMLGLARKQLKDSAGALAAFIAARDADKAALKLADATPADADLLKNDVGQIGLVANDYLLAGRFDASLAALAEAEPATPDQNWLDLVRAASLMFLDRKEEARAVLMKHRGERTYSGKIWEAETLDAIVRLREHGLTHPMMDEIAADFSKPQ